MKLRNHACSVCGKRLRSALALAQHQHDSHGSPLPFIPKRARSTPRPIEPRCVECGALATLVGGEAIYPHRPDLFGKSFYRCACGAYCGCHPNTTIALGYPCGPVTRQARMAAHAAFDPLWKRGSMSRGGAYWWLASSLDIDPDDCHIGMMTADVAGRVPGLVTMLTNHSPSNTERKVAAHG